MTEVKELSIKDGEAGPSINQQIMISSTDGQQMLLSAHDAAQLLAEAGIQLPETSKDPGNESNVVQQQGECVIPNTENIVNTCEGVEKSDKDENGVDDGSILYIDPNDPQAAQILQQAGLRLTEDGSVVPDSGEIQTEKTDEMQVGSSVIQQQQTDGEAVASSVIESHQTVISSSTVPPTSSIPSSVMTPSTVGDPLHLHHHQDGTMSQQHSVHPDQASLVHGSESGHAMVNGGSGESHLTTSSLMPSESAIHHQQSELNSSHQHSQMMQEQAHLQQQQQQQAIVEVGPDQQQVMYSVTSENGLTQQYMMLCPKDMDQNTLIQTLVKQISSDPATKGGKKTIRITQQKSVSNANQQGGDGGVGKDEGNNQHGGGGLKNAVNNPVHISTLVKGKVVSKHAIEPSDIFESVIPDLPLQPADGSTRVYVKCNYCQLFRSTLNGDTWEAILNHILPVAKEEIQTTFYGDLAKHFIKCLRIQINGKQAIRMGNVSGDGGANTGSVAQGGDQAGSTTQSTIPQCEVILTHSLVCRKTKQEFVICQPDATFVANLARHVRAVQPGGPGRGNSILCLFCQSPFTYEDYIRHIQPQIDIILATLNCFAGSYCCHSYETTIRAHTICNQCQEPEATDLRFLPCTNFSPEYACLKRQQFAIDCFREHYGDNGYVRLNTSNLTRCSVCRNMQQVYCAVFQISTVGPSTSGEVGGSQSDNQTTSETHQLAVCVSCQKQFMNIVMKEQNFDFRLKMYQLRNMEQLCSVLRVILNQATSICNEARALIYTLHENTHASSAAAVHLVRNAQVTHVLPITRLVTVPEPEVSGAGIRASFVCDLCYFTVDLTSLIAAPRQRQKNDMLLSIVLEHLVPHTESLMNMIASTAANQTVNLKYEIVSRVKDASNHANIMLSLHKKFKAKHSNCVIPVDQDERKTLDALASIVRSDEKNNLVTFRPSNRALLPPTAASVTPLADTTDGVESEGSAKQQVGTVAQDSKKALDGASGNEPLSVDVGNYIEQQRGKISVLSKTGCNTSLLNSYVECKLCSKFSFPDFRLSGILPVEPTAQDPNPVPRNIDLCENCVETVLTLCLPTEPECLLEAEPCLALGVERLLGHRLVLSNNLKKWLSLDGVNLIKSTIDSFDDTRLNETTTNVFQQGLKTHIAAVLKTCQRDDNIMHCAAGFTITDTFINKNNEAAAKMASLEKQQLALAAAATAEVGDGVSGASNATTSASTGGGNVQEKARTEVQVTIMGRRPTVKKKLMAQPMSTVQSKFLTPSSGVKSSVLSATKSIPSAMENLLEKKPTANANGDTLSQNASPPKFNANTSNNVSSTPLTASSSMNNNNADDQIESISAIQSFLEETSNGAVASSDNAANPSSHQKITSPADKSGNGVGGGPVDLNGVSDKTLEEIAKDELRDEDFSELNDAVFGGGVSAAGNVGGSTPAAGGGSISSGGSSSSSRYYDTSSHSSLSNAMRSSSGGGKKRGRGANQWYGTTPLHAVASLDSPVTPSMMSHHNDSSEDGDSSLVLSRSRRQRKERRIFDL